MREPRKDLDHEAGGAAENEATRIIPIAPRRSQPAAEASSGGYNAVVHAMARIVREALEADGEIEHTYESDSDKLA